jgi:hypothetical protein
MADLALSLSSSPTADTLQFEGYPQDWPLSRARKIKAAADLAKAFGCAAAEFITTGLVMGEDAARPGGPIHNRGVEDVQGGFGDSTLGRVVDTEWDGQGEWEVNRLVGGAILEIKGVGERDVGRREGGTRAVACRDLGGGRVDEADERGGDFDWSVLCTHEPGVIAAVTHEVLEFGPGVGISEGAALGLEDGADALVGHNHVEPRKEVVVCKSDDALRGG